METPPPFNKIDRWSLKIKDFDLCYIFKPDGWRKYVLLFVLVSGLAWVLFGYEGCFDQLEWFGNYFAQYIMGRKTWNDVVYITSWRYGIGTHLSAAVIYGLMFFALSKYYEKSEMSPSLNLTLSFLFTAFSVSLFEFTWMASYYTAQHQYWVLLPLTRQASILYQNLLFLIGGIVAVLFIKGSPYSFRVNKKLGVLILLSASLWALWYFYPLPTHQLEVQLETGEVWKSYPNYPQTMYTIDLNPTDNNAVGVPFFVEDNLVHTINLLMKIVWAYTVFYFVKVVQ